ncbi:MAG: TetR/AcrR family transcriptional regulator [Erysipelothrix sp.]|nr:TetR/AcrR family transcriptional regulator [Erysipelothrix sp.]
MPLVNMPKTQRGQETLDILCAAAERVFYKKGYHNSTIKDITSEANIGLGTFYIYFNDKKSLYVHLLSDYSKFIRKAISKKISHFTDRRDIEREGLVAFLEVVRDNQYIYNIIWESLYIDKKLFVGYYEDFARHYINYIEIAQEEGEMRKLNPETVAYVLMGIANFVGLRYTMFDKRDNFDDIADDVATIYNEGLFFPLK